MPFQALIIDDDHAFKRVLELRLKSFIPDLVVTHYDSLAPARQFLSSNKEPIDLVILDQHLPDGRGNEFLNEGWFRDIAVLSMSSDSAPEIPGAVIQAGTINHSNVTG